MALPTFFVIGAAKAGTTSLHHYLQQHPDIQMSSNKEPNFFVAADNGVPLSPGSVRSREEYERLFDPAFAVRGEASTDYSSHPRRQGVPARIKELIPDAKFVYLVRDPIARTISHYRMRVAFLGERRTLAEALGEIDDPRSPYIWPSMYASQIERYLRHFSEGRLLVVDQADLLDRRRPTLQRIFRFLGVDHDIDCAGFDERLLDHTGWRAYSRIYVRLVDRAIASPLHRMPAPVRRTLRHTAERAFSRQLPKPELTGDLRAQLIDLYAGETARLRQLTGETFPTWSV
jgi:hypothetical protein